MTYKLSELLSHNLTLGLNWSSVRVEIDTLPTPEVEREVNGLILTLWHMLADKGCEVRSEQQMNGNLVLIITRHLTK